MRWWDGQQWTDTTQQISSNRSETPGAMREKVASLKQFIADTHNAARNAPAYQAPLVQAPGLAQQNPNGSLFTFISHERGVNPRVHIYHNVIEREKKRGVSAAKVTAGVLTGGASLLVTGVGTRDAASETIPIRNISSVSVRRDGPLYAIVKLCTVSGETIEFRPSQVEADQAKRVIYDLMERNQHQHVQVTLSPQQAAVPQPMVVHSQPSTVDPMEQLTKLKGLLDAGIVTQEEFDAQKMRLLAQI